MVSRLPSGRLQARAAAGAFVVMLAGCGGNSQTDATPVAWWHQLEGGPIAARRPPPPDANAPWPKLSSVPPRPAPIDPAARASVYAALAADRANATYEAAQAPLTPAPAHAANGLFAGPAALPATPADAAGASLDAATPPPTPPPPPPAAAVALPAAPVRQAAARPAVSAPNPNETRDSALLDQQVADAAQPAGAPPPIPDAPPPPPRLSDVSIPVTVPHLPPVMPPLLPAPPPTLAAGQAMPVGIAFAPGSSVLAISQTAPLVALAARRGSHAIQVIGFGDATDSDPQSQVTAIRLGIERARAVAAALQSVGVPATALQLTSNAPGRGAAVRLID